MAEGTGTTTCGRRIAVIAMDGSKHSDSALEFYVKNVYKENDEPTVIYCFHHHAQHNYGSKWMPVDPNVVAHKYREENEKADKICESLQGKLDSFKIGGKVLKVEGSAGHTIVKKSEEIGASLVVVGTRGHGVLRRKILGSISEYILHHSKIPVFICEHH